MQSVWALTQGALSLLTRRNNSRLFVVVDTPRHDFLVEDSSVVHEWGVWRLMTASVASPTGEKFQRTYVESPGAVAAVPVTADGNVVLVWQYRTPIDDMLLEIPAGMRDVPDEDTLITAQRELAEEAGIAATSWTYLGRCMSSAGLTNSVVHIYLAQGLSAADVDRHGPEEQHMTVVEVPLAEAVRLVETGEIADAKTAIGLLLASRQLGIG